MATPFTTYKLIILYMLQHARESLSNSQISEFILEREYTNYFHLQQAISELVEADLLKVESTQNTSFYQVTEEGRTTLSYFENELSPDIKKEVREYLKTHDCQEKELILMPADDYETPQGSYAVRCQLIEKNSSLVDLTITVPNKEAAKSIRKHWSKKCQDIYGMLMEELL